MKLTADQTFQKNKIYEFEDIAITISQIKQGEKKINRNSMPCGTISNCLTCLTEIPENTTKIFEEIMAELFSNFMNTRIPQIQKA